MVEGDEFALTQVVLNLIRNADQAFSEVHPGRIDVFTHHQHKTCWLDVRDNGPGVPEELAPRIFDPFFTTKEPDKGTGLGLALSADIARHHGGSLSLLPQSMLGATFRLTLPSMTDAVRVESEKPAPTGGRILIIDDEEALLTAYTLLLGSTYEVTTVVNGAEALDLLDRDRNFDLILCDLIMPTMDGPAFAAALENQWPELTARIVFSSGAAMSDRAKEFVERTTFRCVGKPVRPHQVQELLAYH